MTWTPLHATLHQTLRKRQWITRGQSLLLGFSGGQDSLCLLQLLRDLQSKWDWRLALAHCNHRWPLDADANADYVQHLAHQWQLESYLETAPEVLKGEAEGRTWRYQVLTTLAETHGFDRVLTAHTASDRAETLLYNLCRGSGTAGLHGLQWQRPLTPEVLLVRPLLGVTRQETGQFCQDLGLPLWHDSMNQDKYYRRNRLRLDLMPALRESLNPELDGTLAHTAEILQSETDYLEDLTQQLLLQATLREADNQILLSHQSDIHAAINLTVLQKAPLALQRRAIRSWLASVLNYSPSFYHIDKVVVLLSGCNRDRTDPLVGDIIAEVQRPFLCLRSLK
jgi:tRNA(Ile)-lysidine synthase